MNTKISLIILLSILFSLGYYYLYNGNEKIKNLQIEIKKIEGNNEEKLSVKDNYGKIFSDGISNTDSGIKNNADRLKNQLGFPEPIQIEYKLDLGYGVNPKIRNVSKIYFTNNGNNASGKTNTGNFIISGKIINDVEKIEVIWNGDMDSYFLEKYIPGNKEFKYNISTKYGNLKVGENKYLIRGYSKNGIYERLYTLDYYNFGKEIELKQVDEIFKSEDNFNIGYTLSGSTYHFGLDYGKYIFYIKDTKVEFHNFFYDSPKKSFIRIIEGDKDFIYNDYSFVTNMFSNNQLKLFENGDLLFSKSGHESPKDYLFFSNSKSDFFRIFDIIESNIDVPNWYSTTYVVDDNLIIKSTNNSWSEGKTNYELKMNLNTLKIIK